MMANGPFDPEASRSAKPSWLRCSFPRVDESPLFLALLLITLLTNPVMATSHLQASERPDEPPWWDPLWQHRVPISLAPLQRTLEQIQVRVDLNRETTPSFEWQNQGADLRFVYYDDETTTHHLLDHWLVTDRITHGAWFACCQFNGYMVYHSPAATYYTCIRPLASRHSGIHDRTYFTYGDFSRAPSIRSFDHDTKTLSEARIPGPTQIQDDAHGNPSLLIDDSGYVYLFFGCHGHAIQMRRSILPESIEEWSEEYMIDAVASYPQPFEIASSTIVLSYRRAAFYQTHPWTYRFSTDRGETWSSPCDLIYSEGQAIYGITEVGNESPIRSFHLAFNPFNYSTTKYPNIYYAYSDDGLMSFRTRTGRDLGAPPFSLDEVELVYDCDTLSSHVNDLVLDAAENPLILFNVGPWNQEAQPGPGEWRFAWHDGVEWMTSHVAPCDHLFDRGCLIVQDGMPIRAVLPVADDGHDGGEMVEYSSFDGGETWSLTDEITAESEYSHNYAVRVRRAHPELEVIWSYGDSSPTGSDGHDQASEVMLHGQEGTMGSFAYGSAHAYVKVPHLDEQKKIYMYYGNEAAEDVGDFSRTMQVTFTRLPSGETDESLLLEWLMEEGVGSELLDQTAYGNDGSILNGSDAWVADGSNFERRYDIRNPGTALELEGSNFVSSTDLAGPVEVGALSVEIWFKPEGRPPQPLVAKDPWDPSFVLYSYSSAVGFLTHTSSTEGGLFETANISTGQWHHLVGVYDGLEMRVYLDGLRSVSSYGQAGAVSWAGGALTLGRRLQDQFAGRIDEFRLYSRALSEGEIRAHYRKQMDADVDVAIDHEPTSVAGIPEGYSGIGVVSPNPSHGSIRIQYAVRQRGPVILSIFDPSGRRVRRLVADENLIPGLHHIVWDGRSDRGHVVPPGVYFLSAASGPIKSDRKIVLVK